MIINTHIIVHILNQIVDKHEKGIINHIKVCILIYLYVYKNIFVRILTIITHIRVIICIFYIINGTKM